ncbi:hypothetical protein HKX48_002869 [Thoreauomyces humboldtii]|nr:hypothetical protein HKX48_002869 [Thoreauomyces humboldtii]
MTTISSQVVTSSASTDSVTSVTTVTGQDLTSSPTSSMTSTVTSTIGTTTSVMDTSIIDSETGTATETETEPWLTVIPTNCVVDYLTGTYTCSGAMGSRVWMWGLGSGLVTAPLTVII